MTTVLLGVAAVAVGLVLCFRGSLVLRVLIAVWAAAVGFVLGAATVASVTGDSFLAGVLAVVVACACAAALALVAYAFYSVAILVAMAAFGFTIGTDVMVALGVRWSWLIVLAGVLVGLLLAAVAVGGNLPMIYLVVLSAAAGASTVVTGLMLVLDVIEMDSLTSPFTTQRVDDDWWWYALYGVLLATGLLVQVRRLDSWRVPVQAQWTAGPEDSRATRSTRSTRAARSTPHAR